MNFMFIFGDFKTVTVLQINVCDCRKYFIMGILIVIDLQSSCHKHFLGAKLEMLTMTHIYIRIFFFFFDNDR